MKKIGLLILALAVVAGMSLASVQARNLERDGNPYSNKVYPAAKNQADSVLADVHAYSCYISSVRAMDYDPAANAMNLVFRSTDGSVYSLSSLDNGANYTRQGPLVSGSIRYPSSMCDLANQLPFAFYNRGWGAADEGAALTWDDLGYGGGLWASETFCDTTGRGVDGAAIYVVNGVKGSNGRIHVLSNYWGDFTPDAALYCYSDDNGYTWSSPMLVYYDLYGTEDSLALFPSGVVVHDSVAEGYVNQLQIFCSPSGDTVMIGTCAGRVSGDGTDTTMSFFYRMSYDNGNNWTPLTWAPYGGWLGWPGHGYDVGIAVDKDGYPHFATWLFMDTTAAGGYGPNTGLVDYHLTSGGWVATLIHPTDEAGTVIPSFANFALDANGDLVLSYRDNIEGDAAMNIWAAYSGDNGATYHTYQVTTDNGGYDYPHIALHVGGAGSSFPIFYQRGNTGFVSWVPYDSVNTGVAGGPTQPAKQSFVLMQNRPNPVSGNTEIRFNLSRAGDYTLRIYNLAGQTVKEFKGQGQAGANSVNWNAKGMANGMYFYRLTSGGVSATKKMVVVK